MIYTVSALETAQNLWLSTQKSWQFTICYYFAGFYRCVFTKNYKTDFKFIGKVESQTNIFLKNSVLAHFT